MTEMDPRSKTKVALDFSKTFPLYPSAKRGLLWKAASRGLFSFGGIVAQMWVFGLSRTRIINHQAFKDAVHNRVKGTPIITASNHRSVVDDWLLWPIVSNHREVLAGRMRWVLGAEEVMFWSRAVSIISALVRIMPCRRGHGVYQRSMNESVGVLDDGGWVHIYPEGKIIENEDEVVRLKWGIGRLVADSAQVPLVLPMWHVGMDDLVPNTRPYRPYFGKRLTVAMGEPIDFRPVLAELRARSADAATVRKTITEIVQVRLRELGKQTLEQHHSWK